MSWEYLSPQSLKLGKIHRSHQQVTHELTAAQADGHMHVCVRLSIAAKSPER